MKRAFVLLLACSHAAPDEASGPPEPGKDAIVKTAENGPVKATVTVWPAKPTLGDSIYLRLHVDKPAGITVDAPFQEAGDQKMGRFRVIAFTRDGDDQTYTLDAPSSGKQRVPPLRLEMVDARGSNTAAQEILTDEIPIDIAPVKAEATNAEMKPARGNIDPDVGGVSWLWILLGASVVAVAGSGGVLLVRSLTAARQIAKQRNAYDDAVLRLQALEGRGAPIADDADAWFVELSSIVRGYLEQRYLLRAPERTTEEFLLEASKRPELSSEHRGLLSSFLERCDRVKFAGYRPDKEESIATLAAARGFVEDTRLKEAKP
jgi:hypothetical protein